MIPSLQREQQSGVSGNPDFAPSRWAVVHEEWAADQAQADALADRIADHSPATFAFPHTLRVNGAAPSPKDGDSRPAPQGILQPAPAAYPSCAEHAPSPATSSATAVTGGRGAGDRHHFTPRNPR